MANLVDLKSGDTVRIKDSSSVEFHGREVILESYIAAGEWEVRTRANNKGFVNDDDIEEIIL